MDTSGEGPGSPVPRNGYLSQEVPFFCGGARIVILRGQGQDKENYQKYKIQNEHLKYCHDGFSGTDIFKAKMQVFASQDSSQCKLGPVLV